MTERVPPNKERVAIILHSGAYDRTCYALSLALAALSSEMEVHMLLTFAGLRRFTRGHLKDMGEETAPGMKDCLQFACEAGAIRPLPEQLADARKLGLKVYACPVAMASLNITMRDLPEVDEVMGLVSFLKIARSASINWYI